MLLLSACGYGAPPMTPTPEPSGDPSIANVHILPGAVSLEANARASAVIAGQAMARELTLVTHDTTEFHRVPGLKVEDWKLPAAQRRRRNKT